MNEQETGQVRITEELKELGRQLARAVNAVAQSEEVRQLGQELREGLQEATDELEDVLSKVRESEEVHKLRQHAGRVVESIKTGEAQQEIRQGLATALRTLNEQLHELLEEMQQRSGEAKESVEHPAADVGEGDEGTAL